MGGWSADNLHKPIRTNPLCECRPHLACCHAEVQFRRALRLVERQADLSTPKKAVGNGFLARFSQRNLAQHQSLGLLELARSDVVLLHGEDRKSTRLNSSHRCISYAVFCL